MRKAVVILNIALFITFAACNKTELVKPNSPASNEIRFVMNSLPGENAGSNRDIYALVTIQEINNAEVVSNKKLSVSFNGKYVTENLKLDAGKYRITKFLIKNGNGEMRYATPLSNSEKAALVQKPLNISFEMKAKEFLEQNIEVLKVNRGDRSESFGYPAGTFDLLTEGAMMIKLKAVISVGDIIYDSIPASFKIISWDGAGTMYEKDTLLSAGAKEVYINSSHVKYRFIMNKWGINDEITLTKDQLNEETTYILGGAKSAKKLQKDETFTMIDGIYRLMHKSLYIYNTSNLLDRIDFYQKLPQFSDLQFTNRDSYLYSGNKVEMIKRFDSVGVNVGFTEFFYNPQETKIVNMRQHSYDQQTGAVVEYSYPTGFAEVNIDYLYSNGKSMEYKMKFVGGNKTEDVATSTNGGESGKYKYDFNINPYAHMNMPDIYLSKLSRNNLVEQQKNYSGGFPIAEPFQFEYVYDEEGYPVELIKSYKSYRTGEFLYKTKTIYTYQ